MAREIDGDELLGIERLLDTDVIRKSKTASWLLDQVLHDIQAMPTLTPPNKWIPMREQNPEKHGTYLVWDGKEMNTAKWFCVDVPSHGIKAGWSESIPEGGTYPPFPWRVTHWMLLPEPPEVS